jgi:hypothetical protein
LIGNDGNVIDRVFKATNPKLERKETPHGISRWSELAQAKAKALIRASFEPPTKLTDVRDSHLKKALSQMTLTEGGMSIEMRPLPETVLSSIRDNRESASHVTDASDLQSEKHLAQIPKTEPGM